MYKVAGTLPAVASLVLDCTSPNQNERRKDDQVISGVRDQAQTDRVTCKPWTIGRKSSHTCHLVARSAQSVSSIQHYHVWKRNRDPSNQRSRDQTCLTGLCERAYERSISARKSEKAGQTRPLRVSAQVESPPLVVRVVYNTTKPRGDILQTSLYIIRGTVFLWPNLSPFSSLVHLCHLPIPCSEPLSSLPPAFSPRPRPGPRCVWVSLHEPGRQRLACAKLTCKYRYVLVSV
jgi:hypothetical protein